MADNIQRVTDMLSAPMEQVIVALGTGIARAQRELDKFAIQTQREIDEDPLLSETGLQATFYQIPRAELELTMAIALEEDTQTPRTIAIGPTAAPIRALRTLKQLHLQPVNAAYTNQFSYDVQASSKLKLTIVPVPPPAADAAVTPKRTQDQVRAIAQPKLTSATDARLAINFNGQARLWFVLQYRVESDTLKRLALVVVDDETGQIVKSE